MANKFYTLSLLFLILVTVLYLTRSKWLPLLPERVHNTLDDVRARVPSFSIPRYAPLPTSTSFRDDVEAGLHSAEFDVTANVEGDSRAGLDDDAKQEIKRIMKRRGVGFDEARRVFMEGSFRRQGIGADGLPKDPKLVTFS